jgi:DNA-binding response OmpR family regulator
MPKRILIVDDELDFAELVRYRLADARYEFEYSSRGMDALNKLTLTRPDVVLLDILLPDLDGLTLCEMLNRQPATRQVPVILISSLTTQTTQTAGREAGARCFHGKPVDFAKLQRSIEDVLADAQPSRGASNDLESTRG